MRANWGVVILLALAAGYVLLGIYGKYRRYRDEYEQERDELSGRDRPV